MQFYYGIDGVAGFSYCGNNYYYKKNAQNDIIAIFDANNVELCRYAYDAWGNQKTFVKYGENFLDIDIEENYNLVKTNNELVISQINPFRYRGYYYDIETGLYYLNSRYYDPQIGRFVNVDDIAYLSPKEINGLNLYIYCKNNPVMYTDKNGTSWWDDFWEIVVGAIISVVLIAIGVVLIVYSGGSLANLGAALIGAGVGGFLGGLDSKSNGGSYWAGYLGGFVSGGITGFGASMGFPFIAGAVGNAAGSIITDSINGENLGSLNYWCNLFAESILSGVFSKISWVFGESSKVVINLGFKGLFAAVSIYSEFLFAYAFDVITNFLKKMGSEIKKLWR